MQVPAPYLVGRFQVTAVLASGEITAETVANEVVRGKW